MEIKKMTYEIVTKYVKDLSFKINDAKSYFLLEKDIKNYSFICDIKSKKLKEKIIQADVNLRLVPVNKTSNRNLDVKVELTSIIQFDKIDKKDEMEKIILIKVPEEIYPSMREIIIFLFKSSGFNKINIPEKIDFQKLYDNKQIQK
ncbi:MAG: protein-export chaperone SecB [Pseudomonadota bacterium]|nr:protein-export chaperone SecB [Pseudomonadota bacterium]